VLWLGLLLLPLRQPSLPLLLLRRQPRKKESRFYVRHVRLLPIPSMRTGVT
jgi:hypothetical protein